MIMSCVYIYVYITIYANVIMVDLHMIEALKVRGRSESLVKEKDKKKESKEHQSLLALLMKVSEFQESRFNLQVCR